VLTLYRRHRDTCKNAADRYYRKCRCAVWCEGTVEGDYIRRSLKTRSWERGEELKREIEGGKNEEETKPISLQEALQKFVAECEARNLNPSTLRKYRTLTSSLKRWCADQGLAYLEDVATETVRGFRATRELAPRTASKELERLRAFFNFCIENGWITRNPAKSIKPPEVRPNPTLPFSDAEAARILANTDFRSATFFKLLMRSGLRIIDAAMLRPERVNDGKLFLYQQKTGVPVWVPLPPDLLADLAQVKPTGGFFFVVESDHSVSVAEYYRQKLTKAAKLAKVEHAHPHRFRDTFAVNLLQAGVPIEEVSILLGHTDIKTTQKHYSPWVKSRQDRLQDLVSRTWKQPKLVRIK